MLLRMYGVLVRMKAACDCVERPGAGSLCRKSQKDDLEDDLEDDLGDDLEDDGSKIVTAQKALRNNYVRVRSRMRVHSKGKN